MGVLGIYWGVLGLRSHLSAVPVYGGRNLVFKGLRGPSVGYIVPIFIIDKDSESLKDLKKKQKKLGYSM